MCTLNSECWYLLHFLPHGEDGLPHIGIGHLIQTYRLDDLTDARHPNGIGQPVQRVDAANAEEQITPLRGNCLSGHAPGSALGVLLLEPRIVPFVTLAADFVQAAQRGGVELKNGSSPAVYSGKYIGIVTLVVHDVAQIIFLHIVHEGGAVYLQHPITEKCLITGQRLTEVLRHGDALSSVDREKLHLDRRGIRVFSCMSAPVMH